MENLFTHFDLTEFPQIDKKERDYRSSKKSKKNIKRQQKPGEEKNVLLLWKTM